MLPTLAAVVAADPARKYISRIVVPALGLVGRATITYVSGAGTSVADTLPTDLGGNPIPRLRDTDKPLPPVTMRHWSKPPDRDVRIANSPLPEQIAQLAAAGTVGRLNVERLPNYYVISAHAGDQAERSEWLRQRG